MNNKTAESSSSNATNTGMAPLYMQTEMQLPVKDDTLQATSPAPIDAMDNFLTAPSFNTKQMALESFWKQITQGSTVLLQKPGQP